MTLYLGPSEIETFQNVLRFLSYRNLFTEDIDNAIEFAAFCTTSKGRYHSNTYRLLVRVKLLSYQKHLLSTLVILVDTGQNIC